MRANRSRDTGPELALRRALHAASLRYRVCAKVHVGPATWFRPDVVFARRKVAVFVDGCFWHGCPEHSRPVKANAAYWEDKVAGNRLRDFLADKFLSEAGWRVVRLWEHLPVATQLNLVLAALLDARP